MSIVTAQKKKGESRSGRLTHIDPAHHNEPCFYDEMFGDDGGPRVNCQSVSEAIESLPPDELMRRQTAADRSMVQLGITFNVYGDTRGAERVIPFDIIPRVISDREWNWIDRIPGPDQRRWSSHPSMGSL